MKPVLCGQSFRTINDIFVSLSVCGEAYANLSAVSVVIGVVIALISVLIELKSWKISLDTKMFLEICVQRNLLQKDYLSIVVL